MIHFKIHRDNTGHTLTWAELLFRSLLQQRTIHFVLTGISLHTALFAAPKQI